MYCNICSTGQIPKKPASLALAALTSLVLTSGAVNAHELRTVPNSPEQISLSLAPVVERTAPAVVNIYTRKRVESQVNPFKNHPFFGRFFDGFLDSPMLRERMESSLGSGVIIDPDGIVVSNTM